MSKPPLIKSEVKEIVLLFLKGLHEKKLQKTALSFDERNIVSSKIQLILYVQDQYEKKYGKKVSNSTIDKAISEQIEKDHTVELSDGVYQYAPPRSEEEKHYPILKIAKDISVKSLPFDDLCFFEVDCSYASQVAKYLNSRFSYDDIRVIPLGNLLLCLDIALPCESRYIAKKKDLYSRVSRYLKEFDYAECKIMDKHIEGLTAEGIALEQAKSDLQLSEYGGTIASPKKRKIKQQ